MDLPSPVKNDIPPVLTVAEIIQKNRKIYKRPIKLMEDYIVEMEICFGLQTNINYKIDFDGKQGNKPNHSDSGIYLIKTISDLKIRDLFEASAKDDEPVENKQIVACYNTLNVVYDESQENNGKGRFYIENIRLSEDITSQKKDAADKAMAETVRAAVLLVHHAKLAGWSEVHFGNTTDPFKRLALKYACLEAGLICSGEEVDLNSLPQNTLFGSELNKRIKLMVSRIVANPDYQVFGDALPSPAPSPIPLAA